VACEAIRNAARHGAATLVDLELATVDGSLRLRVRDDGTGSDGARPSSSEGFGLRSMAERAAAVGGDLRIRTDSGAGTEVELTL
jgi:signal transduction histidine kinase